MMPASGFCMPPKKNEDAVPHSRSAASLIYKSEDSACFSPNGSFIARPKSRLSTKDNTVFSVRSGFSNSVDAILQVQLEARDSQERQQAQILERIEGLERKLDDLHLPKLQERLTLHMTDTSRKFDLITSHFTHLAPPSMGPPPNVSESHWTTRSPKPERAKSVAESVQSSVKAVNTAHALGREVQIWGTTEAVLAPKPHTCRCMLALANFITDPNSGSGARAFAYLWPSFIFATALSCLAQSVDGPLFAPFHTFYFEVSELAIEVCFCLEVALRFLVAASPRSYFQALSNWADIAAVLPLPFRLALGGAVPDEGTARFMFLCWVPLLRLFKLLRWQQPLLLLMQVLQHTWEVMLCLALLGFMFVLIFASVFFLVEPAHVVPSFPEAVWLTVVTLTTHGHTKPKTDLGHVVVSSLLVSSLLFMALPISILGNAFTEIWKERHLIMLGSSLESRLSALGLKARNIPEICTVFDSSGHGELTVTDFQRMCASLHVPLPKDRAIEIFTQLDRGNGGGSLSPQDLLYRLFPKTYHEMYGEKRPKKNLTRMAPHASHDSSRASPTPDSRTVLMRRLSQSSCFQKNSTRDSDLFSRGTMAS